MDLLLREKVAVITGGASGFGEMSARVLAEEGAKVVIADTNDDLGAGVASQIAAQGGSALFVKCDVSIESQVRAMVDASLHEFGRIDILANVAGIGSRKFGQLPDQTVESWDLTFAVHARGTFLCTQEVTKRAMIPVRSGKIINIGSLAAHHPSVGPSAYSAAKGAIITFTKGCARSLGQFNINCNVISPGNMLTPMTEPWMGTPEGRQRVLDQSCIKRIGTAEDVAWLVAYLASDRARHITGAEINVSAGQVIY